LAITAHQLTLLSAAITQILPLSAPADAQLSAFFRAHRELGVSDRALIAETVFAWLRRRRWVEHLCPMPKPRAYALAALTKLGGVSLRDLDGAIAPSEKAWLNEIKSASSADLAFAVRAELPDWLAERWCAQLGEAQTLALALALQTPAPLDLRVNTLSASRDEVLAAFANEGIEAAPTPYSPLGIRLVSKPALQRHPLFLSGKVEVQDEGSQLLGFLVAPKRREMVVDFCAGAGGKTLLLGALMHSQGRLYAFDVSDKRLSNLQPRLKRSGLSNVQPVRIDDENDTKVKRLAGKIDRVLIDAPCSGFGTLRRNPDLKWRQSEQDVTELARKQSAILASAARLLKPGGRLVYATCSLLREENEAVVEPLLAARPDFKPLDCAAIFEQQRIALDTGTYLKLYPHLHATDGFFAAALEKLG
jgi:16S rRNA (cytosine967-C5)-methyltransferase